MASMSQNRSGKSNAEKGYITIRCGAPRGANRRPGGRPNYGRKWKPSANRLGQHMAKAFKDAKSRQTVKGADGWSTVGGSAGRRARKAKPVAISTKNRFDAFNFGDADVSGNTGVPSVAKARPVIGVWGKVSEEVKNPLPALKQSEPEVETKDSFQNLKKLSLKVTFKNDNVETLEKPPCESVEFLKTDPVSDLLNKESEPDSPADSLKRSKNAWRPKSLVNEMTAHERQTILDRIRTATAELEALEEGGSWADGDEIEALETEIAQLYARLD